MFLSSVSDSPFEEDGVLDLILSSSCFSVGEVSPRLFSDIIVPDTTNPASNSHLSCQVRRYSIAHYEMGEKSDSLSN